MLDYERFSATWDIDTELRVICIYSFGSSAEVVQGRTARRILGRDICSRRAPIADWTLLGNPPLCAGGAHTEFLGEQRGALGFAGLTSLGWPRAGQQ